MRRGARDPGQSVARRSLKCVAALVAGVGLAAAGSGLTPGAAPARAAAAGSAITTAVHPSADCTIYSGAPTDSSRCGKGSDDTVGDDGDGNLYRTILSFDSLGVPAGATVRSAVLTLNVLGTFGSTTTWVFQMTRPFTPGAATWDSYDGADPWTTPGGDFNDTLQATEAVSGVGAARLEIGPMVQSWVDGAAPAEAILVPYAPKDSAYTLSRTGAGAPSLTITYAPPVTTTTTTTTTVTETSPKTTPVGGSGPGGSRTGGSKTHRRLNARLVFSWTWTRTDVRLRGLRIGRLPADASVSVRCRSGCSMTPLHATGLPAARRLLLALRRRRYRPGEALVITLSAAGSRAERIEVVIRRERVPVTRLL